MGKIVPLLGAVALSWAIAGGVALFTHSWIAGLSVAVVFLVIVAWTMRKEGDLK